MTDHSRQSNDDHITLDRRAFIAMLSAAASVYPLDVLAARRQTQNEQQAALNEPWLTLSAVQSHMFPAEQDAPGAEDIRALPYLQAVLQTPDMDAEEAEFIRQGVTWLNDIARKKKSRAFINLDEADREKVLRDIENSRAGQRWLSLLLTYLLEALLSDPVYGGNPDGIGWKWLQHQPGYPTPSKDKMYFRLASRNTFRRNRA